MDLSRSAASFLQEYGLERAFDMDAKHSKVLVKLAGVPMEICLRYGNNGNFFSEYFTEDDPLLAIEPSDEDMERVRKQMVLSVEKEGIAEPGFEPDFIERNVLHALVAERLVQYDVLLIHGSALCMDSDAFLFTARSGVGKSTHARLWRAVYGDRVKMINDDKPMLQVRDSEVLVWGSPWNGKHHLSANVCAPLKAVASLHRAAENHVSRMTVAEAFSVLRQRAYRSYSPETDMAVLELEKRIMSLVPFFDLWCNMNPEAAEIAYRGLILRDKEKTEEVF